MNNGIYIPDFLLREFAWHAVWEVHTLLLMLSGLPAQKLGTESPGWCAVQTPARGNHHIYFFSLKLIA